VHWRDSRVKKLVAEVLVAWRTAQRAAEEMPPDHPLRSVAAEAADQLQLVFTTVTMALQDDDQPDGSNADLEERVVRTSDEIAADLRRMHGIERTKVTRREDSVRLLQLSQEAQALSEEIADKTQVQLETAEEAVERERTTTGTLGGE
jgi:hypothetical protein